MAKSSSRVRPERGRLVNRAPLVAPVVLAALAAFALAQGGYGGDDYGYGDYGAAAPERAGVSTGVFTEEQAARGEELFMSRCSGCHGANLQGGMGPRLSPLNEAWQGMSLASLYRFVSQNMPFGAPGSLEPQQYADAISFVLSHNGFPAGEAELAPDEELLDQFVIDAPPAE